MATDVAAKGRVQAANSCISFQADASHTLGDVRQAVTDLHVVSAAAKDDEMTESGAAKAAAKLKKAL